MVGKRLVNANILNLLLEPHSFALILPGDFGLYWMEEAIVWVNGELVSKNSN